MVRIILFMFYSKKIHWSIWPSVLLCVAGVYLLTDFTDATVRFGDGLVILCALFWLTYNLLESLFKNLIYLYFWCSSEFNRFIILFFICNIFEDISFANILNKSASIIYAGVLSGGIAFTLQIYAQKKISPAPSAIIFSLEGVFAAIAAWIILDQVLDLNNLIGCFFILVGVIISQILPEMKFSKNK